MDASWATLFAVRGDPADQATSPVPDWMRPSSTASPRRRPTQPSSPLSPSPTKYGSPRSPRSPRPHTVGMPPTQRSSVTVDAAALQRALDAAVTEANRSALPPANSSPTYRVHQGNLKWSPRASPLDGVRSSDVSYIADAPGHGLNVTATPSSGRRGTGSCRRR